METPPEQMNSWNMVENSRQWVMDEAIGSWALGRIGSFIFKERLRDHSYVEENDGLMCFREQSFITSERRERVSLLIPRPRARPAQVHMLPSRRRRRRNIALRGAAASIGESHDRTSDVGNGSGTRALSDFSDL